jgi:outer membrane receptor protein involved in Fe transport
MKYEKKNLQKAYAVSYGPSLPPGSVDVASYPYPDPPVRTELAENSLSTEDLGAYAELRWQASPDHQLNLGLRVDDNSRYDAASTVRAGYVGSFGRWTLKALYGEAFQEPNNRLLYGGWDGSGSDPTLEPERSSTTEASVTWTGHDLSLLASAWRVDNSDTFVSVAGGAANLGDRQVSGLDLHGRYRISRKGTVVDAWGYYSRIFSAREDLHDVQGMATGRADIGDLARDKAWLGVTARFGQQYVASVRGRFVGSRKTVSTNPLGRVDSFVTLDAAISLRRLFETPLGLTVRVANLTDADYAHPGVRDASAGATPGTFDDDGNWSGSAGFFNSLHPQPGRSLTILMQYEP